MNSLRKDAFKLGGWGRGMDNRKPRLVKHQHDRLVDKRRRREGKKIIDTDKLEREDPCYKCKDGECDECPYGD